MPLAGTGPERDSHWACHAIRHIAPFDFPIETVPFLADGQLWNRSNWCAIEFDLLYRWHPLAPDAIEGAE